MLRLAVRPCKSEAEGLNLVFISYADFCALAGGEGQQESVRVVLQVRASLPISRPATGRHACGSSGSRFLLVAGGPGGQDSKLSRLAVADRCVHGISNARQTIRGR